MDAKQKAIREAYVNLIGEEKYYIIQYDINFDKGWCKNTGFNFLLDTLIFDRWGIDNEFSRPKTLQGIENNNGWIKIENEEDLPKDDKIYVVVNDKNKIVEMEYFTKHKSFTEEGVTHYREKETYPNPIY